jgi:hypothetical protein
MANDSGLPEVLTVFATSATGQPIAGANAQGLIYGTGVQANGPITTPESGSAPRMGTAVLNGTSAVTVTTAEVTASSRIFLTIQAPRGDARSALRRVDHARDRVHGQVVGRGHVDRGVATGRPHVGGERTSAPLSPRPGSRPCCPPSTPSASRAAGGRRDPVLQLAVPQGAARRSGPLLPKRHEPVTEANEPPVLRVQQTCLLAVVVVATTTREPASARACRGAGALDARSRC